MATWPGPGRRAEGLSAAQRAVDLYRELAEPNWDTRAVSGLIIGYARVSTDEQDLTAQRDALTAMGVAPERIYVDHGLTGTNRARPGLREAMAACRAGDVRVIEVDRG